MITRLLTERPEVVEAGFGHIVGFDRVVIEKKAVELMKKTPKILRNPFGDGHAASKISQVVLDFLTSRIALK